MIMGLGSPAREEERGSDVHRRNIPRIGGGNLGAAATVADDDCISLRDGIDAAIDDAVDDDNEEED